MVRNWLNLILICAITVLMPSCGASRQLESITLIPASVTFQGIGAQIQFKAIGNYIHPPESKDITTLVQWSSNAPSVATITSTGLATGVNTCGIGQILATSYSNPTQPPSGTVVVATAQAVDGNHGGICP